MKQLLLIVLLSCSVEDQLSLIRPGAIYIVHSGDYDGIEWTDKLQVKPTRAEMDQALQNCRAIVKQNTSDPVKDQAAVDFKNTSKTTNERLGALATALGL